MFNVFFVSNLGYAIFKREAWWIYVEGTSEKVDKS